MAKKNKWTQGAGKGPGYHPPATSRQIRRDPTLPGHPQNYGAVPKNEQVVHVSSPGVTFSTPELHPEGLSATSGGITGGSGVDPNAISITGRRRSRLLNDLFNEDTYRHYLNVDLARMEQSFFLRALEQRQMPVIDFDGARITAMQELQRRAREQVARPWDAADSFAEVARDYVSAPASPRILTARVGDEMYHLSPERMEWIGDDEYLRGIRAQVRALLQTIFVEVMREDYVTPTCQAVMTAVDLAERGEGSTVGVFGVLTIQVRQKATFQHAWEALKDNSRIRGDIRYGRHSVITIGPAAPVQKEVGNARAIKRTVSGMQTQDRVDATKGRTTKPNE